MSSKFQIQVDGDTFHIVDEEGKVINKIRISGIDTHESTPDANPTPLGKLASKYIEDSGGQAKVDGDPQYDAYGRQLGEYTDPNLANRAIRQGVGLSTSAENDQAFLDFVARGREKESNPILESTLQQMDWYRESGQIEQSPYKKIDPGADPRGGTGKRAWMRGKENLKASAYAFVQALNDVTGDDEGSEEARMKALYHAEKAGLIRKDIKSYKNVEDLGDAATYAYELLIEEAPSLLLDAGLTLTGAGAGAVIGRRAAVTAMRKRLGDEAFEELATRHPQLMANAAADTVKTGAKRGAAAGFIGGTYPQEVAAVQQELTREGIEGEGATAFGMGAVSTAAQVLPEMALAGKLLKAADVDASDLNGILNVGKEIAKNTGTTALAEGAAETAATITYKGAVDIHKDDYEIFSEKNIDEMKESFVAGATLGGVLGGTSTAGAAGYRKADEIYREKRQAAIDAEQLAREQEAANAAAATPKGTAANGMNVNTPAAEPASPEFNHLFGGAADPANDIPAANENFNPKLDSKHEFKDFTPAAEPTDKELEEAWNNTPRGNSLDARPPSEMTAEEKAKDDATMEEWAAALTGQTPTDKELEEAWDNTPRGNSLDVTPPSEMTAEEKAKDDATMEEWASVLASLDGDAAPVSDSSADVEETPDFPKGTVFSGPSPAPVAARGESLATGAQYGEGNPVADGSYDRGTGRSVFNELAAIAADPESMNDGAATDKYLAMAKDIDPLSDEFDTQLEELAQHVRLKGKGQNDKVLQMLDRARLRTPNLENTVPTLVEVYRSWVGQSGVNVTGEARTKYEAAAGFITQLSNHLKSIGAIANVRPHLTNQLEDIIMALHSGNVEVTPKMQSVVHAIASNTFTSTSDLWRSGTGTTDTVFASEKQNVVDAQNAPTTETAPEAKEFKRAKTPKQPDVPVDDVDLTDGEIASRLNAISQKITGKVNGRVTRAEADFYRKHSIKILKKNGEEIAELEKTTKNPIRGFLDRMAVYEGEQAEAFKALQAIDAEIDQAFSEVSSTEDNQASRAKYEQLLKDRGEIASRYSWLTNKIEQLQETDAEDEMKADQDRVDLLANRVQRLKTGNAAITRSLGVLSAMWGDSRKKSKTLAEIHKRFEGLGEDAEPLKEAIQYALGRSLAIRGNGTETSAVDYLEDEDGKNSDKQDVSIRIKNASGEQSSDAVDLGREDNVTDKAAEFRYDNIKLSEAAEKLVNNFIRVTLGTTSEMVGLMPLAVRVQFFAERYVKKMASNADQSEFTTPEMKNERRVRLGSKLSTVINVIGEFVNVFKESIDDRYPTREMRESAEYKAELKTLRNQIFDAVFPRIAGQDQNDLANMNVTDFESASTALKTLRAEIQAHRPLEQAPTIAKKIGPDEVQYGVVDNNANIPDEHGPKREPLSDRKMERMMQESEETGIEHRKQIAREAAPLSGRTSRDMFDISYGLFNTIRSGVRLLMDARWHSVLHTGAREAFKNDGYAGLIQFAIDHNVLPSEDNDLGKLFNSTIDYAAANRTSSLQKYIVTGRKANKKGVVSIEFEDADGFTTTVRFDVMGFISDHLDKVAPNMVNANHGSRAGSDYENDGVRDTSDPLSGRAEFDRIRIIKDAFFDLVTRMSVPDDRLFGFKVKQDSVLSLLNDPNLLLVDDGADSVTLGHLRDTLATRQARAKLADNYHATHDTTEIKQQKAQAALTLESLMKVLFNILAPRDGSKDKATLLAGLVAKEGKSKSSEVAVNREVENLPRQLAALRDLVYGEDMRHLDTVNDYELSKRAFAIAFNNSGNVAEDAAKTRSVRATDMAEHLFTAPDMEEPDLERLNKLATDARNSASRSKAADTKDYTKTTDLADMEYLSKVFRAIAANPEAFGVDPADAATMVADLRKAHEDLIAARETLALSFPATDFASKADDRAILADENTLDIREIDQEDRGYSDPEGLPQSGAKDVTGKASRVDTRTKSSQQRSQLSEKDREDRAVARMEVMLEDNRERQLDKLYGGLSEDDNRPVFVRTAPEAVDESMTLPEGLSDKVKGIVTSLAVQMSNIVFGKGGYHKKIDFIDGERSFIEFKDGRVVITLPFSSTDFSDSKHIRQFVTEMAHEFGHAATSIHSMSATDAKIALAQFLKEVPEPERGEYDVDEWLADLIATRIIHKLSKAVADGASDTGPFASLVNSIIFNVKRLLGFANIRAKRYGLDENSALGDETVIMQWADRIIERSARSDASAKFNTLINSGQKFYTTRDAIAGMAKAKSKAAEIAKGGLDSAIVKLFKPVAMRLQKIDRQLARMFFNPPCAKQEQGMGLMDMAISTRTQLVNYFGRMYSKVDDFRTDYNKFLETGEASAALNGVFRRAAEKYAEVNPAFKYTGVPLMLNMDELTRRGAEFVQLLDHEDAEALLKSFDRSGGDASMKTDIKPANPFGRQELMDSLIRNRPEVREKLRQAGFFEPPTVAGLNQFLGGVAMRTEFERVFGGQEVISETLGLSEHSPNVKLKQRLDAIKDVDKRREAIAMVGSMLGFDGARVHPAWRRTQDWTIATVSAMILPLSGFASLPDPMMPFIRTRSWAEAAKGLFNVVRMYATDYAQTKQLVRAFSLATNTIHDTVWGQVVANRDGTGIPERMSELLFRYNGLQFLTNLSRNISAVLAIDMVRRHSSGMTPYSRQFLAEMGISSDEAGQLIAYMDEHGTVPQYVPGDERANMLHDIGQRVVTTFTNSSLIHPNKAQLPAIANDPNFRVLTLLKPFLYGFHSIIYGGNLRAGRNAMGKPRTLGEFLLSSPAGVAPLMMAFGIMMPLAAAGLMAREEFKDMIFGSKSADKLAAMDDMEYLSKIFSRAGGYGMLEYPMQIWEATQVDYRNPLITAAGPVAGTLNTAVSSTYGAFVTGNQKAIKLGLFEIPVD